MKNELTLRRMAGLAAIVALIGLVAASCDNAATTNIDCGYALCACGVCVGASCDCESVANDCGYADCGCENCEGAGCDCAEQQAQTITVDMGGGVTMTMNRIAPGVFTMGQNDGLPTWSPAPERQVTLTRGFHMAIHPVTQEQFYAVMGANPSHFSSNPAEGEEQRRRPVERVNWYHAIAFANRLSILQGLEPVYSIEGMSNTDADAWLYANVPTTNNATWNAVTANWGASGFRLPTEAEWEFSARAGTDTQWSFGDTDDDIDYYAWTNRNAGGMTQEVGQLEPNAWGLHDMHGNVWELTWDRWGTPGTDAETDPTGPAAGVSRVPRGGSWHNAPENARSAIRCSGLPGVRLYGLGFRVVRP